MANEHLLHKLRFCLFEIIISKKIFWRGKIPQHENGGDINILVFISDGHPVGCRLHRHNNNGCTEYTGYNSSKICLIYWNRTAWWKHSDLTWSVFISLFAMRLKVLTLNCWAIPFYIPTISSPDRSLYKRFTLHFTQLPRTLKELFWCNTIP